MGAMVSKVLFQPPRPSSYRYGSRSPLWAVQNVGTRLFPRVYTLLQLTWNTSSLPPVRTTPRLFLAFTSLPHLFLSIFSAHSTTPHFFWLFTKRGDKIPAFYIAVAEKTPHTATLLFSHGNAEDLGMIYDW